MILGIDVGGTKTLVASLNEEAEIVQKERFETPQNYQEFINKLEDTVEKFTTNFSVCIAALPGKVDREHGSVSAFGNLPWESIAFRDDVTKFISCPIYIENDSKLAGLSEAQYVKDTYRKVLYLTVSTGIGSVLVVDGKIDKELTDAEVGHMLLEHEGRLQKWEEFASGKAIVARTGKRASEITDDKEWYIIARNIAIGLVNVIANVTPDCVIIGGGVGSHLEKFQARLEEELQLFADNMLTIPPILKARYPEEAVIYGCYTYATQL